MTLTENERSEVRSASGIIPGAQRRGIMKKIMSQDFLKRSAQKIVERIIPEPTILSWRMGLSAIIIFLILLPLTALATDTLTLTDFPDRKIFQRTIGGATANITVTGTFTGSPAGIDARVVQHGTSTEVVPWTIIAINNPTSPFSGTLTVPQGGWYDVQVRFSASMTPQSNGTHAWGVGILIGVIGQSNSNFGWLAASYGGGTDTATANSLVTGTTDGLSWSAPVYNAGVNFANALQTATNLPVGLVMDGVGGSSLTYACQFSNYGYWLAQSGTPAAYKWPTYVNSVTAAGRIVEGSIYLQGEAEASLSCDLTGSAYQTHLLSFFSQLRTNTGSATKIIVGSLNGCDAACSYPTGAVANIRGQQSGACTADGSAVYVSLSDLSASSQHYSAADNISVGQRLGASMAGLIVVNGACGSANGVGTGNVPASNLCNSGTTGAVTLTVITFSWSCAGTSGGTTASCSAHELLSTVKLGAGGSTVKTGSGYSTVKIN